MKAAYLALVAAGIIMSTPALRAGTDVVDYRRDMSKSVLVKEVEEESYFREKEFNVGVFGLAGVVTEQGPTNSGFGGGAEVGYFFTKYIGLSLQGFAWDSSQTIYGMSGSLVLRYPIDQWNLAPYVFGGVGYDAEPQEQGTVHGGAGLEYRFNPKWGIFSDARYVAAWDTNDYVQIRTGVKFAF